MDVCQGEKAAGALGEKEDAGLHLGSNMLAGEFKKRRKSG